MRTKTITKKITKKIEKKKNANEPAKSVLDDIIEETERKDPGREKMNFRELLDEWEDQDMAAYYLACCLGIAAYDATFTAFRETKHIFWTKNPTSKMLYEMLEKMVESEMLEFDDDETRYRWNKAFERS